MSSTTLVTAEQLAKMPLDGKRCELVSGELRMMSPSGWKHGQVSIELGSLIRNHVKNNQLGMCFGAETGFLIERNPDTVRAPDAAFISHARLPKVNPSEAFWPSAPDLAVEVLSPGDTTGEVDENIEAWLAAGCLAVWIADPKLRTVTVYRSTTDVRVYTHQDELDGGEVLAGFKCAVAAIFEAI